MIKTGMNTIKNWKQWIVYGENAWNVLRRYEYIMVVLKYKYWLLHIMITVYIWVPKLCIHLPQPWCVWESEKSIQWLT